jgi:hypothetical protein
MSTLTKNTFSRGLLNVHEILDGANLTLVWEGKSVDKSPGEFLNPILLRVAEEQALAKISIDLTKLTQMNSSTMPSLIIFMKNLERSGVAADFIYSADLEWQRISFQMLANLAKMIPGIRVMVGAKQVN